MLRHLIVTGGVAGFAIYAYYEWLKPSFGAKLGLSTQSFIPDELLITEPSKNLEPAEQRKLMDEVVGMGQPFELGTTYKVSPLPSNSENLDGEFPIIVRVMKNKFLFSAYPEGTLVKFDRMGYGNVLLCPNCDVGGTVGNHQIYYPFAIKQVERVEPINSFSGFSDQPSTSRMADIFYAAHIYTPIYSVRLKKDALGNQYIEALCSEKTRSMPNVFMGLPVRYKEIPPVNSHRLRREVA